VKNSGAKNIHVIAQSMGNQILLRTLESLARDHTDIRFNQIILAAPDVDKDEFELIAKGISSTANGITLYASSTDVALNISKRLRANHPRAGMSDKMAQLYLLVSIRLTLAPLAQAYLRLIMISILRVRYW
jgi:esterase/lipase superfamily enzyme